MRSFDIFNEHIGRIEFAKTKCNGKVLDVAYGEYLVYHTANILLDNKAEEVWSYDISEEDAYISKRFFNDKNEIQIKNQGHPKKSLMKEFFDCIISSETIQHSKNPEEEVDLYYNILKNDGKLIISTSNREAPKKIKDIQSEDMEIKEFSKDEFTDLLSKRFQNIEIFSQRIITQSEIQDSKSLEDIRSREKKRYFFAQIIKKIDPKQKFYSSIVSKIKYSKIINAKEFNMAKEKKPLHQKYLPVMYNEEHDPLFFILVCHKKKMN